MVRKLIRQNLCVCLLERVNACDSPGSAGLVSRPISGSAKSLAQRNNGYSILSQELWIYRGVLSLWWFDMKKTASFASRSDVPTLGEIMIRVKAVLVSQIFQRSFSEGFVRSRQCSAHCFNIQMTAISHIYLVAYDVGRLANESLGFKFLGSAELCFNLYKNHFYFRGFLCARKQTNLF